MSAKRPSLAACIIPSSALVTFLTITFLITWALIGIYIIAPGVASATFGEISGSHPFFSLATWAPAIAAFVVLLLYTGLSGIRALLSRLLCGGAPQAG